jgi:LysR family transcriptional regulator, hydrogen peroxide-inducible genes activator
MAFAPHPFTLRQLQYVVAVADTKSFRGAAAVCHVSQPSLSSQIAQVEGALGAALFERDRRGVLLTPAGEDLVERARNLLRDADDLVATSQRYADPLSGTLRFGVIPTISPYVLPDVAPVLRKTFPRLSLIYREDKTMTLVEKLEQGELDTALLALEANLGDLAHETIIDDPFMLAVARNHRFAERKKPVTMADLEGENVLLLDDGHCLREQALSFCQRAKAEELEFRATSLATLCQMVAGGAGVTLLPTLAIATENRRGNFSVIPFSKPKPGRTLVLAYRQANPARETLSAIAASMRRTLQKSATT